jgi:hypothetical protein
MSEEATIAGWKNMGEVLLCSVEKLELAKEETERNANQLYWTKAKMENNPDKFSEKDKNRIENLMVDMDEEISEFGEILETMKKLYHIIEKAIGPAMENQAAANAGMPEANMNRANQSQLDSINEMEIYLSMVTCLEKEQNCLSRQNEILSQVQDIELSLKDKLGKKEKKGPLYQLFHHTNLQM